MGTLSSRYYELLKFLSFLGSFVIKIELFFGNKCTPPACTFFKKFSIAVNPSFRRFGLSNFLGRYKSEVNSQKVNDLYPRSKHVENSVSFVLTDVEILKL